MKLAPRLLFWAVCLAATAAGTAYLLTRVPGGGEAVLHAMAALPPQAWALAGLGALVFYFLDYVRYASLLAIFGIRLSPGAGFRLTAVSYLVSCLTPYAQLHFPAMVWLLTRRGVPLPVAAAATITKSTYMVFWICAVALGSLGLTGAAPLPPELRDNLPAILAPLTGLALGLGAVAFFPARVQRWAEGGGWLARTLGPSAAAVTRIVSSSHQMHWLCHVASLAFVLAYVTVGWALASGAGLALGTGHAVSAFSLGLMVAYLSPVPGSIGVTEATTALLLAPADPAAAAAVAVAQRLLCWYGVTVPGMVLLGMELRRAGSAPPLTRAPESPLH